VSPRLDLEARVRGVREFVRGRAELALVVAVVAAAVVLPVPAIVGGTLIVALIIGPVGRWVVADPVPMSRLTTLAVGAAGAITWGAIPTELGDRYPLLIPVLWFLLPILAAGALVAVYRSYSWRAPAEEMKPIGQCWLRRGALVAVALFPGAFLALGTFFAEAGVSLDDHDLLEYLVEPSAGVSLSALGLVAIRWSSSRFWARQAKGGGRATRREEPPARPASVRFLRGAPASPPARITERS
jgi:uncharacterized membrane protein YeaQ/YmgE (transglycosylase-associated protein family)